jgi:hypothetical protein
MKSTDDALHPAPEDGRIATIMDELYDEVVEELNEQDLTVLSSTSLAFEIGEVCTDILDAASVQISLVERRDLISGLIERISAAIMAGAMTSIKTTSGEEELEAHLDRIADHGTRGWAVHVRMSALRPDNRSQNYMFALDLLRGAANAFHGALFNLMNSDIIGIFNDERIRSIKSTVGRVRMLFGDDPLFLTDETGAVEFIHYYDLTGSFPAFRRLVRDLASNPEPAVGTSTSTEDAVPLFAMRIGVALASAEVENYVRRQTVFSVVDGPVPAPVFDEIYVSIDDFERALAPGARLAANRWLFQHMTEILDLRVLRLFRKSITGDASTTTQRFAELMRTGAFSLNLNVGSVLTPEFKAFDAVLSADARQSVIIEVQKIDAFADVGRFFVARDHLHERGYRVALDGLNYLSLPLVDRSAMGVDFLKVAWTPEMERGADGGGLERMRALVDRAEPARVILCRCDSLQAIECGRRLGLSLFQGWEPTAMATGQPRRSA